MGKVGRPPFEITEEVLQKVEAYAQRGLTQQQIADALGICTTTLHEKKKEYTDFSNAIKRGKAKGIAHVANCLIKNVENGNAASQIFYLKCQANWKETDGLEISGKDGAPIKTEAILINAQDQLKSVIETVLESKANKEEGNDTISRKPND